MTTATPEQPWMNIGAYILWRRNRNARLLAAKPLCCVCGEETATVIHSHPVLQTERALCERCHLRHLADEWGLRPDTSIVKALEPPAAAGTKPGRRGRKAR